MEFQKSITGIWNEAPVAGKALIIVAGIGFIVAIALIAIYGPKN